MKEKIYLLLIGVFMGVYVLLFYTFYYEAKKSAIERLYEEQMIHAKQAAKGIEEFFMIWTGTLTSLARMDEIINNDIDGKRYMWLIFESHRDQIKSVTRVDEKGTILYTVPYTLSTGSNISTQKHFQKIIRERKPVISDVFKAVQGFDAIALHVPVLKGDLFKGTIAILIDFEDLTRRYLEVIKIGETGFAWLIQNDGIQLYSPDKGSIGKSVFDNYKEFPAIIPMLKNMLQGHHGRTTYIFNKIGNQKVKPIRQYAVYMPIHIGNTFWSIAVASSETEVIATLSFFRNRLILIIIVIFMGVMLFSIEMGRSKKALQNILGDLNKAKTELEIANVRLKEIDRLKSAFLATMSHELRTPLNSIIGFTGILLQGLAGPLNEEQHKQLSMVQSSARHLLALINDVLDISKIEAGELAISVTTFELRPVIEKVVKMVYPFAEKKGP
jgi:hypothetical protein